MRPLQVEVHRSRQCLIRYLYRHTCHAIAFRDVRTCGVGRFFGAGERYIQVIQQFGSAVPRIGLHGNLHLVGCRQSERQEDSPVRVAEVGISLMPRRKVAIGQALGGSLYCGKVVRHIVRCIHRIDSKTICRAGRKIVYRNLSVRSRKDTLGLPIYCLELANSNRLAVHGLFVRTRYIQYCAIVGNRRQRSHAHHRFDGLFLAAARTPLYVIQCRENYFPGHQHIQGRVENRGRRRINVADYLRRGLGGNLRAEIHITRFVEGAAEALQVLALNSHLIVAVGDFLASERDGIFTIVRHKLVVAIHGCPNCTCGQQRNGYYTPFEE